MIPAADPRQKRNRSVFINQAANELEQWLKDASESNLSAMVELAKKISRHKTNILNSIRCHANSAKSESTNTTIKVLIKMARGFRNLDNMIALIYLKCSDLVIPLHNRCQMTSEQATAQRTAANEAKKQREKLGKANVRMKYSRAE